MRILGVIVKITLMRIFAHHISKTNQPIVIGIGMMDLIDRYISQEQIKKAQYYKNSKLHERC